MLEMMQHADTMDRVLAEAMAANMPLALGTELGPRQHQ